MAQKQADIATDLAIHDPLFVSSYNSSQDKYWIGNVTPSTFSEYGFIGTSGAYIDVSIQLREYAPMRQDFLYTIDVTEKKVVAGKMVYSDSLMGREVIAYIPPEAYFYRKYLDNSSYLFFKDNSSFPFFNYDIEKKNPVNNSIDVLTSGPVQPGFLNNSNLYRLKNGTEFDTLVQNQTMYVQGELISSSWSAYIPAQRDGLYFVLKNPDNKNETAILLHELSLPWMTL